MSRITHFEIHASQPQALITYYTALLGWTFSKYGAADYWLIETGPSDEPGINGGLLPRRGDPPLPMQAVNAFVCTAQIASLDETLSKKAALGGSVAVPKMPISGLGWLAYVKDPDGNIMGPSPRKRGSIGIGTKNVGFPPRIKSGTGSTRE